MARFSISVGSLLVVLVSTASVVAQDGWPIYPLDGHNLQRGPGGYLSWPKLLALWVLFLIWVKTTDWVNKDTQLLRLPHSLWNPVNFFPFFVAFFLLALNLPNFIVGYAALALCWLVPLVVYIYQRNASVEHHEKVLTPDHLRFLFAQLGGRMGMKVSTEKKAAYERGAPVQFTAIGGKDEQANQAKMILARQSIGFVTAKDMVADAMDRRGDKIMLDYAQDAVAVRYQIDGVWHEAEPQDRETGDALLEAFKHLATLDPKERRKRQLGDFETEYKLAKYRSHLVTQGTKTGERAIVNFLTADVPFESMVELGMREKMQERLKELLGSPNGLFLFSAVPGGGLTTTMLLALKLTDRYMRDFMALQDVAHPEPIADNIEITTYDTTEEEPQKRLTTVLRKEPDVLIVNELVDANMVELLCERAVSGKLIISSIRAKEAVEALLRVLLLKVSAKQFAPAAIGVLNQRLIRKLCESCKDAYTPTPEMLKKLGIPKGRVESLYRPPEKDETQPVCPDCAGIGYVGRTSIFELLVVDDTIREALVKQPKLEVLRKVAKQAGNRTLQEEGILLVVQGITSLAELMRALKQ